MFAKNKLASYIKSALMALLFVIACTANFVEFLSYFIAGNEYSFLSLPMTEASAIEFFTLLALSLFIFIISIILIRTSKLNVFFEYFVCIVFIAINLLKLLFYIPNIGFDQAYLFYTLKQFIPLIPSILVIAFAYLKVTDLKYEKY